MITRASPARIACRVGQERCAKAALAHPIGCARTAVHVALKMNTAENRSPLDQHAHQRHVRTQAAGKADPAQANPLKNMTNVFLIHTTDGAKLDVASLVRGKTVLALLRHLGCPMCQEQARNLLGLKPRFDTAGYKLIVVSIGTLEGGRQWCDSIKFPEELLYLDSSSDRQLYKQLKLKNGLFSFWSPAATAAWMDKDIAKLRETIGQYALIPPPTIESTAQQGGLFVIDGATVLYAHQDPGIGAHAPNAKVLAACCSGVTAV